MLCAVRDGFGWAGRLTAAVLVLVICGGGAALAYDCVEEMGQASEYYAEGRFEEAIGLLESCLNQADLDADTRGRAYRLLGMTYIAMNYRDQAKSAITNLLELVPDYQPDPELEGPVFVEIVDDVRGALATPPTPVASGGSAISGAALPYVTDGLFISAFLGLRTMGGDDFKGSTYYRAVDGLGMDTDWWLIPELETAPAIGVVVAYQKDWFGGEFAFSQSSHDYNWSMLDLDYSDSAKNRYVGFNAKVFPGSAVQWRPFILAGYFWNKITVENGWVDFTVGQLKQEELDGTGFNLGGGVCYYTSPKVVFTGGINYHSITIDRINSRNLGESSSGAGFDVYVTVGLNVQ